MSTENDIVKQGDFVIFDTNNDKQAFIMAKPKTKVRMGAAMCSVEPIIGKSFGSIFILAADGKSIEQTSHVPSDEWTAPEDDTIANRNKNLIDAGDVNQQLTKDEIAEMKATNTSGDKIVEALTSKSATFATKTNFAQEKYKTKKKKKYVLRAVLRRPTAASVSAVLFSKFPGKFGYVRPDSLGLLLNMANVGPGSKVLVWETAAGIITGAVAERLGGFGTVCTTYIGGSAPQLDAVKYLNFSEKIQQSMYTASLQQLIAANGGEEADTLAVDAAACTNEGAAVVDNMAIDNSNTKEEAGNTAAADEALPTRPVEEAGAPTTAVSLAAGASPPFNSCIIIAPGFHPLAVVRQVLPLLSPSTSFAILHPWPQPLAETMHELKKTSRAVNLSLQECWTRAYQVLPKRTHPMNQMNHGGGFFLNGITVKDS